MNNEIDTVSIWTDAPDSYDEMVGQEPYFSWFCCDCCNERLGGSRYDVVGLNPGDAPEDYLELSVCVDCYCDLVG
jgi:hypothetical protein